LPPLKLHVSCGSMYVYHWYWLFYLDENNVYPLFESLDRVEKMLDGKKYLVQETFTEADIRLWTTIVRFDPVYFGHFKCNKKSIEFGYPNILEWARRIYQKPGSKFNMIMCINLILTFCSCWNREYGSY
jgi:glutathionyl-hydroquinone reductase